MPTAVLKAMLICPLTKIWETMTNVSEFRWRRSIIRVEEERETQFTENETDGKRTKCIVTVKDLY